MRFLTNLGQEFSLSDNLPGTGRQIEIGKKIQLSVEMSGKSFQRKILNVTLNLPTAAKILESPCTQN